VKIAGMSPYEDYDEADRDRTYFAQPAWQRAVVICAGSITHFLLAGLLLFGGLAIIGLPEQASNEIREVVPDSPAAEVGLEAGDEIVAVDGEPTEDFPALAEQLAPRPGEEVELTIRRDGELRDVTTRLGEHPENPGQGYLGFQPEPPANPEPQPLGVGEAAVTTVVGDLSLPRITVASVVGIAEALSPQGLADWFGSFDEEERGEEGPISPVGIGQIVSELGEQGHIFGILLMLVQLNIVLGTLNMLPLPPLDGGHFAVIIVEKAVNTVRTLRGRTEPFFVDPVRLTPIALLVILFFGTIMLAALYLDIIQPASQLVSG
jgi:membrane-associated protease RseP (regulator of RpoE activity)